MRSNRARSSVTATGDWSLLNRRPSGALRPTSVSRSFSQRSSVTTTGLPSGRAWSSATVSHSFGCRAPCLRIAIELLLERIEADAAVGFEEPLIGIGPLLQIDVHDGF